MNSMQSPQDPIDPLLERWRDAPPPPPTTIEAEVWRRIAEADGLTARPTLFARMEAAFARPSFSVAFVAACMLLGLFLAEVRLTRLQAERNAQLAQSYRHLIDPLLTQTPDRGVSAAPRS